MTSFLVNKRTETTCTEYENTGEIKLHVKPLNRLQVQILDGRPVIMFYVGEITRSTNNTHQTATPYNNYKIDHWSLKHICTSDNDFRTDVLSILNAYARADRPRHTLHTYTNTHTHTRTPTESAMRYASARTPNASHHSHHTSCCYYFVLFNYQISLCLDKYLNMSNPVIRNGLSHSLGDVCCAFDSVTWYTELGIGHQGGDVVLIFHIILLNIPITFYYCSKIMVEPDERKLSITWPCQPQCQ